ncbi:MAG TPA: nucleotide pyrophosphatase/phosphodiesterase family protein [Candidatus Dormibacteraeota bacterium]|nr:nucleotide pyrophosphatase/phosphodiesterase family protein [Candidatus Dormibacteraeota bacterium]
MTGPKPPPLPLPRYGSRTLAEVVPSLLSSLGMAGFANPLQLEPAARACLLLVDGLGWELLRAHQDAAPFLNSLAGEPLTAGFPATTAASISSLATGLPPGEHGLVGYTMALPGYDRAFNTLTWSLYGLGPRVGLLEEVMPEVFQPLPTLPERAAAAGVPIHYLGPAFHQGSGLSRAVSRGQRFHPADSLEAIREAALTRLQATRAFVHGYHPRLDTAGHVEGVASQAWRDELVAVDRAVRTLAEALPAGTVLVVTGDHGMVDLRPNERIDLADHRELAAGVTLLAGEARARYVRTAPGAAADVVSAWRSILGDRMWVWTREEAVATGIFGPRVSDQARERIGDLVAAAYGRVGIVQRDVDPAQARLNGHHGSLTPGEQLVPLLTYRS